MEGKKKAAFVDIIVVGFAMFAVFFGAGNLIFPPYLGMMSGEKWILGFLCFILADAGLAISTGFGHDKGRWQHFSHCGQAGQKSILADSHYFHAVRRTTYMYTENSSDYI